MNTPETAKFYASFADGIAVPNQDEWLAFCERLEKSSLVDKLRLDWLQANQKTAWRVTHDEWDQTTETIPTRRRLEIFDGWVVNEDDEPQKDIRAAIDAAMSKRRSVGEPARRP